MPIPFMFFNTNYLLFMLPAMFLMMAVQAYVNNSYKKWSRVPARSRMSGAEAANHLIRRGGLSDVQIGTVSGKLSDHYDPRTKVLSLSPEVYQGASVASLAIAAHELGHAMQDREGYAYLRLRGALVPVVNIGSMLGWLFIIVGLIIKATNLAWLGVIIFAVGALFALLTLPVEFNASSRAKAMLTESGLILGEDEQRGVNTVLNAAALTYVAGLITAVMQLLYYASLVMGTGGRRR